MDLTGMEAGMYLRKSRAEDGQDTDTILQRHRETLTEYAAAHGIHVIEVYPEVVSGESLYTRPQMLRLLEDVEAGKYQCVLCMDMDRLSRGSMRDQGLILDTLKYSGTLIVTPDRTYDLSTEADEQFAEIKTFLSRQEYRAISKRMQRGRMQSIKNGYYISKAPFGYRNTYGKFPTLEIYEPEAKFVRMAFEMALSGIGGTTIARKINGAGMRTRENKEFNRLAINRILHNPVYIGKIPWNRQIGVKSRDGLHYHRQPKEKWIVTDGIHPPIIDVETFDAVQEILSRRHSGPHFDGIVQNPLSGIVRCRKCGNLLQRRVAKCTEYLLCPKPGCCSMTRLEFVESRIMSHLANTLEKIELHPAETAGAAQRAQETVLETVRIELKAAEDAKKRLYELVEAGAYSVDEFRERMEAVKEKISRFRREEAETMAALDAMREADPAKQAERIRNVLDLYQSKDAAGKNILLKSVINTVWYTKKKKTETADFILEIVLKGT